MECPSELSRMDRWVLLTNESADVISPQTGRAYDPRDTRSLGSLAQALSLSDGQQGCLPGFVLPEDMVCLTLVGCISDSRGIAGWAKRLFHAVFSGAYVETTIDNRSLQIIGRVSQLPDYDSLFRTSRLDVAVAGNIILVSGRSSPSRNDKITDITHQLSVLSDARTYLSLLHESDENLTAHETGLVAKLVRQYGETSGCWLYVDAEREFSGGVLRWDLQSGEKIIRPVTIRDGELALAGMPAPRPLYNLPEVIAAVDDDEVIFVVEGEPCVDAARGLGLVATTSAQGSQSAAHSDWSPLAGSEVAIIPDNDASGKKYATKVAEILTNLDPPARVKILDLGYADVLSEADQQGADIVDWIMAIDPGIEDPGEVIWQKVAVAKYYARGEPTKEIVSEESQSPRVQRLLASASVLDRAARYLEKVPPAIAGEGGHNQAFRAACVLIHDFDLSVDEARPLFTGWCNSCQPPWSNAEIEHKLEQADRAAGPRGKLLADQPAPPIETRREVSITEITQQLESHRIPPDDCMPEAIPPGLIADVVDFNLRTAIYPQPVLAIAAAITLMSTLVGRNVTDQLGTRANLYILGLAPSGSGKEHARKINKMVLEAAGLGASIGPERIGSSAGVITAVEANPNTLMQIDEIGRLLDTMKNPSKSPHLYNIASVLMQLYSSSDTTWIGDAYADLKKVKRIVQPSLSLYGTCVAERFWDSLTVDNLTDGLLGRLLPFEANGDGYVPMQQPERAVDLPPAIVDAAKWWARFTPADSDEACHAAMPQPVEASYAEDAWARLVTHLENIGSKRHGDPDSTSAAIWSRSGGKTGKLALIFACSRQSFRQQIVIEKADVDLAIQITNFLTRRTLRRAAQHVSTNQHESDLKRVERLITGSRKPITRAQLCRRTQWLRRRDRDEILTSLCESGSITCETSEPEGRGRPVTVYSSNRSA